MSASSAMTLKAKARITFKRGPSGKGKKAEAWCKAGYIPADSIVVDFPAKLLPDIAYISTTLRNGERGVMVRMAPDGPTQSSSAQPCSRSRPARRRPLPRRDTAA